MSYSSNNVSITISIHALLAESDRSVGPCQLRQVDFYPRSPCGERLVPSLPVAPRPAFLSTLSLRRATPKCAARSARWANFYPRSPCGERPCANGNNSPANSFLSTLSLRRATDQARATFDDIYISIHALLAESDVWPGLLARPFFIISIHALLAESDLILHMAHLMGLLFLSTLSLRRATAV